MAAINPKTKQLRQQLRAACMERNDVAAFSLIVKILEIEPGDGDLLEQKKAVGRRLFDTDVNELAGLIDAGDNERLLMAMDRLSAYVDSAYAAKSPVYAEALSIVTACKAAKLEAELTGMFADLVSTRNLAEKDKKATKLETFATNSGISLTDGQKKTLSEIHNERKAEIERTQQENKLEKLKVCAYDLGSRVKVLQKNFDRDVCAGILSEIGACAQEYNTLDVLDPAQKEPVREEFERLQRKTQDLRHQFDASKRMKLLVRSVLSTAALIVVGIVIYLYSTVGGRVRDIQERFGIPDIPYIQGVVSSWTSRVYALISHDYASELDRCRELLAERKKQAARYKETVALLDGMKKNITPANVLSYISALNTLEEIRKMYLAWFKEELDTTWTTRVREYENDLGAYYDSRREVYSKVDPRADVKVIINQFNEFKKEFEFALNASSETRAIYREIVACYTRAVMQKYQDYATLDEHGMDKAIAEIKQILEAGIPLDDDFLEAVGTCREDMSSIRMIRQGTQNARSFDEYVRAIRANSDVYKSLPDKFNYSTLTSLCDNPDRIKRLAQRVVLQKITKTPEKINLAQLSTLKRVFEGTENAYMGAMSSSMYSEIKELAAPDKKSWPSLVHMLVQDGYVYLGKVTQMNEVRMIKGMMSSHPFAVAIKPGNTDVQLSLEGVRTGLGIKLKKMEDGEILPVGLLTRIAKLTRHDAPAYVRLYLFERVVRLMQAYKNPGASGIALSPTLQKDIATLKNLGVTLVKGGWMNGYSVEQEAKCQSYLSSVASHDYLAEIQKNILILESANFIFVGYVNELGEVCAQGKKSNLYVYSESSDDFEQVSAGKKYAPFTPVFRLSHL